MGTCSFLSLLILTSILRTCTGGACSNNALAAGKNDVRDEDDDRQSYTGINTTTLLLNFPVQCCGPLERSWINTERLPDSIINGGTNWLELHVYRPISPGSNDFELVFTQYFSDIRRNNDHELTNIQPFIVEDGDYFGIKSEVGIVSYDDNGGDSWEPRFHTKSPTPVGMSLLTAEYSANSLSERATFGFEMRADASADPTFINIATGNINNNVASGVSVLTVSVSDTDVYDELTLSWTSHSQFNFDTTSGLVTTGTITEESDTAVSLTITVTDICGKTEDQIYTVNIDNDPPVHQNLGAIVNLTESTTAATYLFTVECNDTRTSPVTITYTGGDPFVIRSGNQVWYDASSVLRQSVTSTYTLPIVCTDGGGETDVEDLVVNILPNIAPSFVAGNNQFYANVSLTTNVGAIVFYFDITNPEADDIIDFTINVAPDPTNSASCPDYFDILDNGYVMAKQSMAAVTDVGCEYLVFVSDGYNNVPARLTIVFTDFDAPMSCNNLPANRTVLENTPAGHQVIAVGITDNDVPQPKTFQLDSSVAELLTYFQIDSNGVITTTSAINYEALTSKSGTLIAQVFDDRMTIWCQVNVFVLNQGEAPTLDSATYVITGTEGPRGLVVGIPVITVYDEDAGDTFTYFMDCGTSNGRLGMDSSTGQVTLSEDYDLDPGALPSSVTCTVTVRDSYGLEANATLQINLGLINDNNPQFGQHSYSILVYPCGVAVGSVVGTVTATDADAAPHSQLTYTLEAYQDNAYFHVAQNGQITAVRALNCSTDYNIRVTVRDQDGGSDTADVEIIVSATTPAPTTTQGYEYIHFLEDWRNFLWLVPLAIILLVTLVFICWVACTCRGEQGCSAVLSRIRGRKKIDLRRAGRAKNYGDHPMNVRSIRQHQGGIGSHSWN